MKFPKIYLLAITLFISIELSAQNVAINTDGSSAHSSAILDVKSTTAGMLVPRMTFIQRTAIAQPAMGLLVFQSDGNAGFYYYSGTAWQPIISFGVN